MYPGSQYMMILLLKNFEPKDSLSLEVKNVPDAILFYRTSLVGYF